ncbi:MAG: LysR family transcriptional regulator [Eubacteriales bacterium]|nr:LysR family transcriptional regulator [Eubacteriales bacterium]
MNTKHFDYIIAIAETGNLSLAAKKLHISQPILSRYLDRLESTLSTKLFVREKRHFHITAAGEIYLDGVRRMQEIQTQMYRFLNILQGSAEQSLKIGMSPFRGGQELAAFYPALLHQYPNLNLTVLEGNSNELYKKLCNKEISLMINLYDSQLMPGTKAATLTRQEILIALPRYHPLSMAHKSNTGHSLTVEQLRSLTDISFVYLSPQTLAGQLIENACMLYEFSPQILLCTENSLAVSSLLSSGNYAGFLLEESVKNNPNLVCFHMPHPLYLYSGMIFQSDHQPNSVETYLFQLEYEQVRKQNPGILHINDFSRRLLA